MPKDKDFKRLVRARMHQTGERYTQARGHLRPEAPPSGADATAPRVGPKMPATVVPMDFEALVRLRAQLLTRRGLEVGGLASDPPTPRWVLDVSTGGPLDTIELASVSLSAVAALGTSLHGVGYFAMGLDLDLPLPAGAPVEDQRYRASGLLREAQAALFDLVRDQTGFGFPPEDDSSVATGHRFRTSTLTDGSGRVVALTKTSMMIRPGREEVVDLGELEGAGGLPGRPWAGCGVLVVIDRAFPQQVRFPNGEVRNHPHVPRAFWDQAGEALRVAAAEVQLPAWPLDDGWVRGLSTMGGRYQHYWGAFGQG